MRLKEFHINSYGPIFFESPFKLGQFNLFYGKNERGKTLTIEALIKLLYRKFSEFDKIERVEELPLGYIIIEDDDGESIRVPGKRDFMKLFQILPSEFRNIFVIRSSDLSIPEESKFYAAVTDRITGLDIMKLEKIRQKLFEIAAITPKARSFSDSGSEKLRTRIEKAREIIEQKIPQLIARLEESNYDSAVESSITIKNEIELLREKKRRLEDARKGKRCRDALAYLDNLSSASKKLDEYRIFDEQDYRQWSKLEREKEVLKENFVRIEGEITKLEENLRREKEALDGLKKDIEHVKKIYDILELELRPEIERLAADDVKLKTSKGKIGLFRLLLVLFGVIAVIFGVSSTVTDDSVVKMFFLVLTLVSFLSCMGSFISMMFHVFRRSRYHKRIVFISQCFSRIGLEANNLDDFLRKSQRVKTEYEELQQEYPEVLSRVKSTEEMIKNKNNELQEINRRLKELDDRINNYRYKFGVGSLDEFAERLGEKEKVTADIDNCRNMLGNIFPLPEGEKSNPEKYWMKKIEELKPYLDKADGIDFKEEELEEIESSISRKDEELGILNQRMDQFKSEFNELEKEVNAILRTEEDYYFLSTKKDLEFIRDILSDFINEKERLRKDVILLDEVLEELKAGEKRKVSQLFGPKNPISRYFSGITGGRYSEVSYDPADGVVMVKMSDGTTLEAWKLSSGAYDQLYLSIRLSLAEALLEGRKGFFIFDDPFVKSDHERLRRQLELLKELSLWGWQILYFTSKDEVPDALKDDINKNKLLYFELNNVK